MLRDAFSRESSTKAVRKLKASWSLEPKAQHHVKDPAGLPTCLVGNHAYLYWVCFLSSLLVTLTDTSNILFPVVATLKHEAIRYTLARKSDKGRAKGRSQDVGQPPPMKQDQIEQLKLTSCTRIASLYLFNNSPSRTFDPGVFLMATQG